MQAFEQQDDHGKSSSMRLYARRYTVIAITCAYPSSMPCSSKPSATNHAAAFHQGANSAASSVLRCSHKCRHIQVSGMISFILGTPLFIPPRNRWNHTRKGTILYNMPCVNDIAKPSRNNTADSGAEMINSSEKTGLPTQTVQRTTVPSCPAGKNSTWRPQRVGDACFAN